MYLCPVKQLFFIFSLMTSLTVLSQDSLKVMYHNMLNFPGTTPDRADSLRNIISYIEPDVYAICELETEAGADLILDNAFNVYGKTNYARAAYYDGLYTDNMLIYNTDKLGLVSQEQIGTVLRDISVYRMYYKAPNLTALTDTIYCYFFVCHLKAGSADYQQRNIEIQQAKFYLNSISAVAENVFIGGDMNVYSGFESAILTLKNTGDVPMFDPINVDGNWSSNSSFADYHTQSTRFGGGYGGGSGGGMDDRFDLIFVSEDVLNNDNGVQYLSNSYEAVGQDGNRYNQEINSPTNFSVPDSVSNALFRVSDHLPVVMTVVFDETATIANFEKPELEITMDNVHNMLRFNSSGNNIDFYIYNSLGQEVLAYHGNNKVHDLNQLVPGVYLVKMRSEGQFKSKKIILSH